MLPIGQLAPQLAACCSTPGTCSASRGTDAARLNSSGRQFHRRCSKVFSLNESSPASAPRPTSLLTPPRYSIPTVLRARSTLPPPTPLPLPSSTVTSNSSSGSISSSSSSTSRSSSSSSSSSSGGSSSSGTSGPFSLGSALSRPLSLPPTSLLSQAKSLLRSPHDAAIWALAAPSILALAADPLLAMVDTAFAGQLGEFELAALGVNNSLFSFAFVVFNFLATATTPIVATALAADDKPKAGQTILQALLLATALGSLVTCGLELFPYEALRAMGLGGADEVQLSEMAHGFLVVRATAAPAALLVTVSQGVFRGLQDVRTPLAVTLATNLLHLVLSTTFMFNLHMGLPGAALSTSISEWVAAGLYMWLGWGRRACLGLSPWPPAVSFGNVQQYLPFIQAGGAILMRTTVLLGTKTLATVVATRLGPAAVASHQVLGQVWVLSSLVIDSLGIAGQTMVAVSLGAGERDVARQVTDRLLQLGLALGTTLAGLLMLASPIWPHLFTKDASVISGVDELLPLAVAMLPVNALVYVLDGVFVGAADFNFLVRAMVLAAGSTAGLLTLVEPLHLGLSGIWGAMALLMVGRFATLAWRYQSHLGPLPPLGPTCPVLLPESAVIGSASVGSSTSSTFVATSSSSSSTDSSTGGSLSSTDDARSACGTEAREAGGATFPPPSGTLHVVVPLDKQAAVQRAIEDGSTTGGNTARGSG